MKKYLKVILCIAGLLVTAYGAFGFGLNIKGASPMMWGQIFLTIGVGLSLFAGGLWRVIRAKTLAKPQSSLEENMALVVALSPCLANSPDGMKLLEKVNNAILEAHFPNETT